MAALKDFIQNNFTNNAKTLYGGAIGSVFAAGAIAEISTADNKLKALLKTLRDIVLFKPMMAALGVTMFKGMKDSITSLLHDTGSLTAALNKLAHIQGLQQMFAPLVGGAQAAKVKVAELVNLAASKNLKLQDVSEASKSLSIMTRNAYSGAKALSTVIDVAAGTGSPLNSMANAIGEFSAQLRSGGPIDGAAEVLRQMGAISQTTADELVRLQQNGASGNEVFNRLTSSLESFSGSAEKAKDSIDGVNAAYEAASANLQEKFASPFTESEVQNTKNWTSVMQTIAPVVEEVSGTMTILTNGVSSTLSVFTKWLVQIPGVTQVSGMLVKALASLVAVAGIVGGLSLAGWFLSLIPLIGSMTGGVAKLGATLVILTARFPMVANAISAVTASVLRFIPALAGLGIAAGVVTGLVATIGIATGIVLGYNRAMEAEKKAADDLRNSHIEMEKAMQKQINSADSLVAKHEAITKSLEDWRAAQDELNKATSGNKPDPNFDEKLRHARAAEALVEAAKNRPATALTPEEEASSRAAAQQSRELSEQRFQSDLEAANPQQRVLRLRGRSAELSSRADRAQLGADTATDFARQSANANSAVEIAQKQYEQAISDARAHPASQAYYSGLASEAHRALNKAQADRDNLAASAPKDSSTYAFAQARMAANPRDRSAWQQYGESRLAEEKNITGLRAGANQTGDQASQEDRALKLSQANLDAEKKISDLKNEGFQRAEDEAKIRLGLIQKEIDLENKKRSNADPAKIQGLLNEASAIQNSRIPARREQALSIIGANDQLSRQQAQLSGNHSAMVQLDDKSDFVKKFTEFFSISGNKGDAARRAREFVSNSIALSGREASARANSSAASSSLAKIAGGGNVADVSNDMLETARRQEKLLEESKELLKTIADAEGGAILQ